MQLTDYYVVAYVSINGQLNTSIPNVLTFIDSTRGLYIWSSGHVEFSYKKKNNVIEMDFDQGNGQPMFKGVLTIEGNKINSLTIGENKEWQSIEMIKVPDGNFFVNNHFTGTLQNYHSSGVIWTTKDTLTFLSTDKFQASSSRNPETLFNYTVVNNGVAYGSGLIYNDPWVLVQHGQRISVSHASPSGGILSYGNLEKK